MSSQKKVKEITEELPALRKYLFTRGFLLTDKEYSLSAYPFYGNWSCQRIRDLNLYVHEKLSSFVHEDGFTSYLLVGHAYNPYNEIYDENVLLKQYATAENPTDVFNQWTGVFTLIVIRENTLEMWGDCAGMQATYYGVVNDKLYISSHAQLIGDLCELKQSAYAQEIVKYRFWQLYGMFLPGDCSQFDGIYRLVPNTYVVFNKSIQRFAVERFYPLHDITMCKNEEDYNAIVAEIGRLLHTNLDLISKKWSKPAISMSGGMDSKATFACANGLYDRFKYYSYDTMYGDQPDVEAAKKIADAAGVSHNTYVVSQQDSDFPYVNEVREIMEHNWGDIGKVNANDVRKRMYFMDIPDFDVEVKSWVSEIGRANYYKKFGLKKMPKHLSPRQMTSMYKFFSYNRKQAKETDRIFTEYISKTKANEICNLDASDLYLWEFRYGSWGGLVITSEHRMSYDITIPYNNRNLMELFLRLPLEKRIADVPHYDLIRKMNPAVDSLNITITNYNETKKRMHMERLYYFVNNLLPY